MGSGVRAGRDLANAHLELGDVVNLWDTYSLGMGSWISCI